MPAKEIKEFRRTGKLEDALAMAKIELNADPNNIWPKRNISWVFYEYIKRNSESTHYSDFLQYLNELVALQLPADEKMVFDNVAWQVGKMIFALAKQQSLDLSKIYDVLNLVKQFHFTKPSDAYTFLLKAFHKALKDTPDYTEFIDWWGFENLQPVDHEKEKLPDGKEVMSLAEQVYIAYAKHLLPNHSHPVEVIFDKIKAEEFLPKLIRIAEEYPTYQYPAYFHAKLLLALGDKENMLSALLPFAKKKRNDFWVWEILAEAFINEPDKVFACYCKALSCQSPEEMLVSLRQKMAGILISKKLHNEAKTEIELLIDARNAHGFKIPNEVVNWQSQEWYKNANGQKINISFYKQYIPAAEAILFSDTPDEMVLVEFVNSDKKMLNFIASETKFGFFKYDRFFKDVKVGDTLKVRFQGGAKEGMYQLYTAIKSNDEAFRKLFLKEVEGDVRIPVGKPFGFLGDVFIHPSLVSKLKLTDGFHLKANAIKSYNQDKKQWGWKLMNL